MSDINTARVAIAGASGFIGTALCAELPKHATVTALSRRSPELRAGEQGLEWRQADLFSLLQVEAGVAGSDTGIYLVHSMQPTSRLTQGSFADIDLILADNFARAAHKQGLKRIIYLGGIIPRDVPDAELSPHLRSRLEVERALGTYGAKVIALRCGLVVGAGGSSFQILEKLVRRLPLMLCPRWTQTLGQPIALSDLVALVARIVRDQDLAAGSYDVGGASVLSYIGMLKQTAQVLGLRRGLIPTRFFTPGLSRLWVATITGSSRELIYPLIESLKHEMLAAPNALTTRYDLQAKTFSEALQEALQPESAAPQLPPPVSHVQAPRGAAVENTVCSIQRIQVPAGRSVRWTSQTYSRWLPRFLSPLIRVDVNAEGSMRFYIQPLGIRWRAILALQLLYSAARSDETRSLFYITGGVLSDNRDGKVPGRFEFRKVPGRDEMIIAILNYQPRLPWWFYVKTQARVHLFVMRCFGLVTRRLAEESQANPNRQLED